MKTLVWVAVVGMLVQGGAFAQAPAPVAVVTDAASTMVFHMHQIGETLTMVNNQIKFLEFQARSFEKLNEGGMKGLYQFLNWQAASKRRLGASLRNWTKLDASIEYEGRKTFKAFDALRADDVKTGGESINRLLEDLARSENLLADMVLDTDQFAENAFYRTQELARLNNEMRNATNEIQTLTNMSGLLQVMIWQNEDSMQMLERQTMRMIAIDNIQKMREEARALQAKKNAEAFLAGRTNMEERFGELEPEKWLADPNDFQIGTSLLPAETE